MAGRHSMRLIVGEVTSHWDPLSGEAPIKQEGTTWYPDGKVFVITREGTPKWFGRRGGNPKPAKLPPAFPHEPTCYVYINARELIGVDRRGLCGCGAEQRRNEWEATQ